MEQDPHACTVRVRLLWKMTKLHSNREFPFAGRRHVIGAEMKHLQDTRLITKGRAKSKLRLLLNFLTNHIHVLFLTFNRLKYFENVCFKFAHLLPEMNTTVHNFKNGTY